MAQKPWRVVEPGEDAGRLTRDQVIAAVEAVKARKEAERRNERRPGAKRKASATKPGDVIRDRS